MDEILNGAVCADALEAEIYEQKFGIKEKHEKLLDILVSFDSFCRENGICYSLADGTLLGAVRHSGFIPWDDDADVMMTRKEYEKLRKALCKGCGIRVAKAVFLDRVTTDGYAAEKEYIDLFINEDMPASRLVFFRMKFCTAFLRTYFSNAEPMNERHAGDPRAKKLLRAFLGKAGKSLVKLIVGGRDIFDLNDKAVSIKSHAPSGIYTRFTSRMYETRRRFCKESYDAGYEDIMFSGKKLMAIKNADTFLCEMFGDYKDLPPEEKRVPAHAANMLELPENCIKWLN